MPVAEQVWTIVVGGGSGRRFGTAKQFESLGAQRVIDHARTVAESVSAGVVVVVPPEVADAEHGVAGGATRADSVRAGLAAVPDDATIVCVHDAARPFADADLFGRVIDAVSGGADGAVPGVAVTDTIKIVESGVVATTPDRASLVAVQTPQAFRASVLREAHRKSAGSTDDAAMVEELGYTVVVVDGDVNNRKITHPDDLAWARGRVASAAGEPT